MHRMAARGITGLGPGRRRSRRQHKWRGEHHRPPTRPYGQPVADELVRARWSRFVTRALKSARSRGFTNREIHAATGINPTTFHRWARGDIRSTPDIAKVRAFCTGLGLNLDEALTALGMTGQRDTPEPEPPMPPEVRTLLRRLADPNVSATDKVFIQESLRMLADRLERQARREASG